jgi:hypothetical protein
MIIGRIKTVISLVDGLNGRCIVTMYRIAGLRLLCDLHAFAVNGFLAASYAKF